ncbi:hypothetical protein NL676_037606 [Syzygium grande]|nr:hypothetical protein NL676_037606 [Syzygium grande]
MHLGLSCLDFKSLIRVFAHGDRSNIGTSLGAISSNISAATFLASVSLTLCSNNNFFASDLVYGDTRPTTLSIKYISLLICFLLAFSCFIRSVRHFVHANYLISTPSPQHPSEERRVGRYLRRRFLIRWAQGTLLCSELASLVLRTNTNVYLLHSHGLVLVLPRLEHYAID